MANGSSRDRAARVSVGVTLAAILGLAFAAYLPLLGLDHLGWDTWPLLVSARVASLGDLAGSFTEELMNGRYPHGDFYRPVLSLSVGFDGVFWGLRPFGYHLTDLLLLLLTCVAAFAAGRRLLGDPWAALAACALFALHPLHFESLPVTARRGDALAGLFTLLALVCLPSRGQGRGFGAMLFAVLAVGSKETGLLAAPLLVVLAFVEGEGSPARRWRDALRVAAPALIALAVFLLLRLWVLGGLGGHGGSSLVAGALRAPLLAWLFVPALLVPQPLGAETLGLALALALAAALVLLRRFDRRVDGACLVSGAWLVGLLLLSGISGDLAPWYAASLLPAYGLLYGALVAGALAAWRGGARPLALASLLVALLAAASPLRHSGLFQRYPQWQRVSTATTAFLSDLGQRIRVPEAGGAVLRVSGLPDREPHKGAVGLHGSAAGLAPYSVQAWADATLHPRRVRIVTEAPTRIDPDEIVVLLHRP